MEKKNLLPFGMLPGHWGLSGYTKEIAKLDYEYEVDSYEYNRLLLEINLKFSKIEKRDYDFKMQKLRADHTMISAQDYDYNILNLEREYKLIDEQGYTIRKLELDYKYKKIEKLQYEKEIATAKKEPWVTVIKISPSADKPSQGEIELDWNEYFVAYLKENGYQAPTNEQLVDQWFTELSKNVALEYYSGIGDFDERVGATESQHHFIKTNNINGKTEIQ